MSQYSNKGLTETELYELRDRLTVFAPSLLELMKYLINKPAEEVKHSRCQCPPEWSDFIHALASASPVCALVKPDKAVFALLQAIKEGNITRDPQLMISLQHEVPVLFKLLSSLHTYPRQVLGPIVDRLIEVAEAPFVNERDHVSIPDEGESNRESMSFFPSLPTIRKRKIYGADSVKGRICTKKSYGHPVLLPGIFTMYCKHGK